MRYFFAFFIALYSTFSLAQQDSLHVYFDVDETNLTGGELDVEVYVNDWVSLVGVQIFVKWDSTVLEVTQVPFINNSDLTGPSVILPFQNNVNPERGQAKYNFFDFSGPTLSDSTHIFTLRFDVVGQPCDETSLTIGDIGTSPSQKIEVTAVDQNGNLVTGVGANVNESLFGIPGTNCDAADPVEFNFPSISGNPGDNVCIPLTVMNFDSIDSFGGSVNWNPNLLEYTGVQNFGVAGLSAADFSNTPGNLLYAWADLTANNPETLADGTTLFEICFDLVGAPGTSSSVTVSNTPNQISVTMAGPTPSDPSVPLMFTIGGNGGVSIVPPMGASPVDFFMGDVNGSIGTNVCIPMTVNDFQDITSFSGSINWDPTVISFTGVQGFGIGSLNAMNFTSTNGVLTYDWMDPVNPATLSNGALLFEVCYDVIGSAGSSTSIDITDNPTPITVVQEGAAPGTPGFTVGSGSLSIPAPPAPDPIIITFGSATANLGDNICVPVTLDNFTDMVSFSGSVTWDPTVIQYTGTQNYGLSGLASMINDGPVASGRLGFSWSDVTPATPETLADGSTMMEICFEVVGAGGSNTVISISDNPTIQSAGYQGPDPSQQVINVAIQSNSGQVFVAGGGGGSGDEVIFTFPDLTGATGTNVCVPLTVENFVSISSVNGSVNWDPGVLTNAAVGSNNLPGFTTQNFFVGNAAAGQATFVWSDGTALNPLTLPDGEFIFEVCFDVIGAAGDVSPISVTDTPTGISVSYADPNDPAAPLEPLDFILNNGSYTIEGGGGGPISGGVTLTIPDECYAPGANFCIPVAVDSFINIAQLDFTLEWDPSIIDFMSVGNSPLSGFNPSSMVFAGNSQNGVLTFSWFDGTAVNPNTFPDGTAVVEFCFQAVGAVDDVSPLNLVSSPTEIVVGQAGANPADPVRNIPFTLNQGSVKVGLGPVPEFGLVTSCPVAQPGELACVDFIVSNFNELVITEWNWRWDPADLNFAEVRNIHPNAVAGGLSEIDFGFFGQGRMNVAWTGAQTPVSIPDGETYFTICYDILAICPGDDGSLIDIEIFESQVPNVPFVVTDDPSATNLLPYDFSGCSIEVDCPTGTTLVIGPGAATLEAPSACNNTGSLSVPISGGVEPYMMTWSGGNAPPATTFTNSPASINNLSAGTYNVTISDATGATVTGGPYTLSAPNPLVINPTVINVNCNSQGSITVNATGGTPPYQYSGPNGSVQTHTGLNVGSYRIEVRDQDGCSQSLFVEVVDDCPTAPLECFVSKTDAMCGLGGTITATSSGGVGNVLVFFDPPISSPNNVAPNITYTVTFIDGEDTECVRTVTINDIAPPPIQINCSNILPAQCNGVGGSVDISITGGCEPVACRIQQIINGEPSGALPCSASGNLLPGDYQIIADPNFGDNAVKLFTIPPPVPTEPLVCEALEVTPAGPCFNQPGTIRINASGGCGNIRATVSPQGSMDPPLFVNINTDLAGYPAGSYDVVVTDGFGSTVTHLVTVGGPTQILAISIVEDTCQVEVIPTGGVGSYTYEWSTGPGNPTISTDPTYNLQADTIDVNQTLTVIVSDDAGCSVTGTATLFCPADTTGTPGDCDGIAPGLIMFPSLLGGETSCAGLTDCNGTVSGVISQECHQNGASPYSIIASDSQGNNTEIILAEPGPWSISGLCAEVYSIIVEDSSGGSTSAGVNLTIEGPDPLTLTMDSRTCSDMDEANGTLDISVEGGPVGTGYEIVWTDNMGTEIDCDFGCDNLASGIYNISATSTIGGCEISDVFEIEVCIDPEPRDCEGIPVFTPNADGLNDFFTVDCLPLLEGDLSVYDRWGRLVHTGNNYQNDWDGTDADGQPLTEGAYHWVLIMDNGDGTSRIEKGTVTLLRNRP